MSKGAAYVSLENPIDSDTNIIRIDALRTTIEEKQKLRDDVIVKEWEAKLTKEYITEKIMEAEMKGNKRATLLQNEPDDDYMYQHGLFNRSRLGCKILDMIEPRPLIFFLPGNFFGVYIEWGAEKVCCVIL